MIALPERLAAKTLGVLARGLPRQKATVSSSALYALVITLVATLLRLALDPLLGLGVPFISFFPAVMIAAVLGGALAGLLTLLLCAVMAAFFWFPSLRALQPDGAAMASIGAFLVFGSVLIGVALMVRVLLRTVIEAEERSRVLAHEMKHRIGNTLAVVQALVRQTRRSAHSLEEFDAVFTERIAALARAQDVVSGNPNLPTELRQLLAGVLRPFGTERFSLSGPTAGISADTAMSLALLVHELATNALKYGALSVPAGRVELSWRLGEGRIDLGWQERDGPPVTVPERAGFGSKLLKTAFAADMGETTILYEPDGVRCAIALPAASPAAKADLVAGFVARP